ncbi:LysR family transcriptional regulator [Ralstonia sp. R-29]|uniref:LysR family transcriptional regulator n=1 Tax=Ralstonia sp. R-29 TaxID=3404059 RepID=UPI003CE9F306
MSTVRFLRTFVAVARHGSLAAAAERVALTQAAVSLQMRALEAELRRDLFDRSGRTVTLNAHGRALLPQAEHLLALYDAMRIGDEPQTELSGAVAIGAVVSVMGSLAHAVAGLKQVHKGLDVKLITGKSGELAEQVEAGELDGALVVEHLERLPANLAWHPLYTEPLVVVAGRNTRGRAEEVLRTHPFLRFDRAVRTGALIDRALRKTHMAVNEFIEVNSIEAIVELVRQQVGVTLVPRLRRASWESDPALRVLPMPPRTPVRAVGMIERKEHVRHGVIQAVLDALETTLGKSSA